jgi:hypothetical protein
MKHLSQKNDAYTEPFRAVFTQLWYCYTLAHDERQTFVSSGRLFEIDHSPDIQ